jgi:hypothetical protein
MPYVMDDDSKATRRIAEIEQQLQEAKAEFEQWLAAGQPPTGAAELAEKAQRTSSSDRTAVAAGHADDLPVVVMPGRRLDAVFALDAVVLISGDGEEPPADRDGPVVGRDRKVLDGLVGVGCRVPRMVMSGCGMVAFSYSP